jgi:hypothetical protein
LLSWKSSTLYDYYIIKLAVLRMFRIKLKMQLR